MIMFFLKNIFFISKEITSQARWFILVVSAFRRCRQDCELDASLGYMRPVSKEKKSYQLSLPKLSLLYVLRIRYDMTLYFVNLRHFLN